MEILHASFLMVDYRVKEGLRMLGQNKAIGHRWYVFPLFSTRIWVRLPGSLCHWMSWFWKHHRGRCVFGRIPLAKGWEWGGPQVTINLSRDTRVDTRHLHLFLSFPWLLVMPRWRLFLQNSCNQHFYVLVSLNQAILSGSIWFGSSSSLSFLRAFDWWLAYSPMSKKAHVKGCKIYIHYTYIHIIWRSTSWIWSKVTNHYIQIIFPTKKLVYAFGAIKLVIHLKEDAIKFEHKNPIPLSKRFSLFFATKRKV